MARSGLGAPKGGAPKGGALKGGAPSLLLAMLAVEVRLYSQLLQPSALAQRLQVKRLTHTVG